VGPLKFGRLTPAGNANSRGPCHSPVAWLSGARGAGERQFWGGRLSGYGWIGMAKEPKTTYRVILVKEGGFAVEVTTKGVISHTEFGFKTEDEALDWIEAKRVRNSN
jgi:hypothetical protein